MQRVSARVWYERMDSVLAPVIDDLGERKEIIIRLLAHYLGYDITKHVLEEPLEADEETVRAINAAIERIHHHEPIQYILGHAPFLSYDIAVNPSVLIPRPETEEMVGTLLSEQSLDDKHILDICTGSGCIAIALKKACHTATIDALDISEKALSVARGNATRLKADIHWYQLDLLHDTIPEKTWDIMISNPPYIPLAESMTMDHKVLDFEPHIALFVPNDNPYIFYHRIAAIAKKHLNLQGSLYVECHERSVHQVKEIVLAHDFGKVTVYRDLQGKERWIRADL